MPIKGFVGFWGYNKENFILKLREKFESSIYNSRLISNKKYSIIASSDLINLYKTDKLIISSEKNILNAEKMVLYICINNKYIYIKRDRWGARTLYYVYIENNIYFSSDIRFLLSMPIQNIKEYNLESLNECSTLGYILEDDKTLFLNINQLPRNSELKFSGNTPEINRKIISANKDTFTNFNDAYYLFEKEFENTVRSAFYMKGKNAFLLSGGMDSSAIAIAAAKSGTIKTVSFSSENNLEDIYFANKIAEYIGSHHTILEFQNDKAIENFPSFMNDIECVEMEGIFSPFGGYAYYLLCKELNAMGFNNVFPGEGADEILGGYYWQLTHSFGFVDKIKEKTKNTSTYKKIINLFPDVEEREFYRELIYYFLQGTALTNYHLSCIEHTAKSNGLYNYPIYMTLDIYNIIKNIPIKWLCDGKYTKIILRKYLLKHLKPIGLSRLINRKKMAMPSVISLYFMEYINKLALKESKKSECPFKDVLQNKKINIFMLDIFHKYYTLHPLESVDNMEWNDDIIRIKKNECIIHW